MNNLNHILTLSFTNAIFLAFPHLEKNISADIGLNTKDMFWHYQCNSALKLAKPLGEAPRHIAEKIMMKIHDLPIHQDIQCEVAGPGFINIRFNPIFLGNRTKMM